MTNLAYSSGVSADFPKQEILPFPVLNPPPQIWNPEEQISSLPPIMLEAILEIQGKLRNPTPRLPIFLYEIAFPALIKIIKIVVSGAVFLGKIRKF